MFRSAAYHVFSDALAQQKLEEQFAQLLYERSKQNVQAFRQYMPSLLSVLSSHTASRYSVMCDKSGYLNIVDFSLGQVFYPNNPETEAENNIKSFCQSAVTVHLRDQSHVKLEPLPKTPEVVVMFGLGLGFHVQQLIERSDIKHLIIYEPEMDFMACSSQIVDWQRIFTSAQLKGTAIYLQLGQDGSDCPADLAELSTAAAFDKVYLYRHYSHPVMDKVFKFLQDNRGNHEILLRSRQHFLPYTGVYEEVDFQHAGMLGNLRYKAVKQEHQDLFDKNMQALRKHYPQVFQVISEHKPSHWQLVTDHNGNYNLWHQERNALHYFNLEDDSEKLVNNYCQYPFQDDVLIGHRPSYKLRTYLHNQQVQKMLPILEKTLTKSSLLPAKVDSLIVFGVALGRHLPILRERHQITNWYICEPNLDFFYASLFVTDWAELFEQAELEQCRIYLNLGGDGSEYFTDFMRQFYQVGAYSIANTYMMTSYFNSKMQEAISHLRSELRVVLAIGEYFDHARFNIAHAYQVLRKGARVIKQNSLLQKLAIQRRPLFIVGNGPSLDQCFDYLHQYKDDAIIVSCGTALKALHKQGITPDFHAELEQNRASYFWINQVDDDEYLRKIRLLAVNGVHPDVASLFAEAILCFKDGEASTQLYQPLLEKHGLKAESLSYAFPTVSNFAIDLVLKLGFENVYLFGVDLGFIDIKHHHSKSSAYYNKDNQSVYDYQKIHGGGLMVPGNFKPMVFTKSEFNVSRKLQEQAIRKCRWKTEVYNCSNGAKIQGATPLLPENILLPKFETNKAADIVNFITEVSFIVPTDLVEQVPVGFDDQLFEKTMHDWQQLIAEDVFSEEEAKALIDRQWMFLLRANSEKNNPAFMLFNGSNNYFSAILLKLAVTKSVDGTNQFDMFNEVLSVWREYLARATEQYLKGKLDADVVDISNVFASKSSV